MILLIAIPLLLRAVGSFCERRDSRLLCCAAAASAVFMICGLPGLAGLWDSAYDTFGADIRNVPFGELGSLGIPPANALLMKLCAFFGDDPAVYPLVTAGLNAVLAGYAVRNAPYHGSSVLCFMFIPAFFCRSGALTAALICTIAAVYIQERRFFRYAALVLLAACFDMSALLTLPLYFVTLIPGAFVPAALAVIIAALVMIFPGALDGVYGAFGGMCEIFPAPVFWAVISCIAAAVLMLMYAMFRNREGKYERLVPVMLCGAALTAAAAGDGRLCVPAMLLLMQAAVPLADEAFAIGSKFVGIMFKENQKTAQTVFLAVCVTAEAVLCACLIYSDAFGASVYGAAVETVFGL